MAQADAVDVMIVSLGSTPGLRRADEELQGSLVRAGASVALAQALPPREVRTLLLTDLRWARAARAAARQMLARFELHRPRALIYSTTTAALLWPRPGAVRFDAPSAGNRPGRHGLWQRPLERLRLQRAPLLLPWSEGGLGELPAGSQTSDRVIVLPVAVERSDASSPRAPAGEAAPGSGRDIAAITYAANPSKKGLDRVLEAWRRVRAGRSGPAEEELLVAGATPEQLAAAGYPLDGHDGVRALGVLAGAEYRGLLRRARVFLCAPRREDYGLAQLEALADGCLLVTTPAPGPYAALPIARSLDPRLVSDDLASALRAGLDDPLDGYAERALQALAPFRRESVDRLVADRLLPRLLA
jgi:hypothetical protein